MVAVLSLFLFFFINVFFDDFFFSFFIVDYYSYYLTLKGETQFKKFYFPCRQFSYQTHKSQVKFLQYLAKQARQRIIIHCKNMVAIYDNQNRTYDNAVTLISFDEEEMSVHAKKKAFRYKVVEDGCQVRGVVFFF